MYILGVKAPKLVWQAIGEIEHYLYKIGIRRNFESEYTYTKTCLMYATNYKNKGYKRAVILRDKDEKIIKRKKIGLMLCKAKTFYHENIDFHEIKKNKKVVKKSVYPIPLTEKRIVFKYEKIEIKSIIDRINFSEDGYSIIDYKSSLDFPAVYNREPQYTIYDVAATQEFGKPPNELLISTYLHPKKKDDVCKENFDIIMESLVDETLTEKEIQFRKMVDHLPTGKFELTKIQEKNDNQRQKVLDLMLNASIDLKNQFEKNEEIKINDLIILDKIFGMRDGRHCHYCIHEKSCAQIEEKGINSLFPART